MIFGGVPFNLLVDTKQFHWFSDSSVTILPKAMAAGSGMLPPASTLDPDSQLHNQIDKSMIHQYINKIK